MLNKDTSYVINVNTFVLHTQFLQFQKMYLYNICICVIFLDNYSKYDSNNLIDPVIT